MTDIFNMTDTWNNAGTEFTAIKMDVTDTNSQATSKLIDLLVGGSTKFAVDKSGNITGVSGSGSPALTGKQALAWSAMAMLPAITNGPSAGAYETTTNKQNVSTLDFDATTSESAQFDMLMPPSWNEGTITFQPVWSHPSTATNFGVVWELSAVAISDDDALDVAFGTGQTSTDTGGTTDDIYIGPESSAITVGGSPATGDFVRFKIARLTANGSDTLAVDARLHGIRLYITTAAGNDA